MVNSTNRTPALLLPMLQQEEEPTATDMRKIQNWAQTVPATYINYDNVPIGSPWPANIQPFTLYDYVTGTTNGSGHLVISIPTNYLFTYSYGYFAFVNGSSCQAYVVTGSSTTSTLTIACYTYAGSAINTGAVAVTYQLFGA